MLEWKSFLELFKSNPKSRNRHLSRGSTWLAQLVSYLHGRRLDLSLTEVALHLFATDCAIIQSGKKVKSLYT